MTAGRSLRRFIYWLLRKSRSASPSERRVSPNPHWEVHGYGTTWFYIDGDAIFGAIYERPLRNRAVFYFHTDSADAAKGIIERFPHGRSRINLSECVWRRVPENVPDSIRVNALMHGDESFGSFSGRPNGPCYGNLFHDFKFRRQAEKAIEDFTAQNNFRGYVGAQSTIRVTNQAAREGTLVA